MLIDDIWARNAFSIFPPPPNVGRKLDDINTEEVVNLLGTFTAGLIHLRFITCHG